MTEYEHQRSLAIKAFDQMREEQAKDKKMLLLIDLAEGLTMSFISSARNFERMAEALETANKLMESKNDG